MSERDPRVDPEVGDVLMRNGMTREVTGWTDDESRIMCRETSEESGSRSVWPLPHQWCKWAATATVVLRTLNGTEGTHEAAGH